MAEDLDIIDIKNRREFDDHLARLGEELRQTIELECAAFPTDPQASRDRALRAVFDYQFFCQTYFPHYVPTPHFSAFHRFIFERFPACIDGAADAREVHQAPRGEAKSTYETQLGTLWSICRAQYLDKVFRGELQAPHQVARKARKHMIVVVMNTEEQAAEMLESIKAELDTNPRLLADFPEATGRGRIWQATTVVTAGNIKIRIGGTGKKLRGMKHGPHRPDLVYLDDLENDENVRDKGQRDKVEKFVLTAVLGLAGPAGGMDVFWPGTSLHYDAAINRVSRKPGWRRKVFKSITRWPDRMDLWDRWEGILHTAGETDDDKAQAEAKALAFYLANQTDMDAGAVVSWPEVRPLYRLMVMRATDHDAFNQEQQNEAGNDDSAPFRTLQFWVNRLPDWIFFGALDPSMGKKAKSRDPSAILVGGLHRPSMTLDVVEADIGRKVPDLIIARAVELQAEYRCLLWEVESVAFQEFLYTELIKRAALAGIAFPAQPTPTGRDKDLAILSLQPHIKNGKLRLHRSQSTLVEQLRFYPEADHDDGPDALEMLWRISNQFSAEWAYTSAAASARMRAASRGSFDDWDEDND